MSFTGLLISTCSIQQKTLSQQATGESLNTAWANKATGVACRVNPDKTPNRNPQLGEINDAMYKIYIAASANVALGDRIVVGSDNYEVLHCVKDSSGHHWEVTARIVNFK